MSELQDVAQEIGGKIRYFRKKKGMTIQELAGLIHKGKSAVSKYEKGQIIIDIVTLYEIAEVLGVHTEQLLYNKPPSKFSRTYGKVPAFFKNLTQFYMFFFDGRNNSVNRSVIDVYSPVSENEYKVMLYMNIQDYAHYQNCENTYWGFLRHYDTLSSLELHNRDNPIEILIINLMASFLDSSEKWGLFTGISSRPLMPVALKALFTKIPMKNNQELVNRLKISKDDIRLMKVYNMLTVTGHGDF
ncbi:MAG: helix-turn-helix transcriptional regulator [Synergistaceae bacterium]|nr:helix-turn-helix transcriptional regulator [Synergistaceae bacterium]